MTKDVMEFLTNKNALKLSEELVTVFSETACCDIKSPFHNLDCDFVLSKIDGSLKERHPNTTFKFDPKPGTLMHDLKQALFVRNLNEDELTKVKDFLKTVQKNMVNDFSELIRSTLRRVLLNGAKEEDFPLSTIQVTKIDIVDFSSVSEDANYVFSITKKPTSSLNVNSIANEIMKIHMATEKPIENIIDEGLKTKQDIFEDVIDIRVTKLLHEIGLEFFVDYAIAPREIQ